MFVQFNPSTNTLVDEQNIMLPKGAVFALAKQCLAHLKHTDDELRVLGRASVVDNHSKNTVLQFDFDDYYP